MEKDGKFNYTKRKIMKQIKFQSHYNKKPDRVQGEVFTLPSKTIPDQSMSITEIMRRYATGLPLGGEKVPLYDEENILPDPRSLDLVERQEMADQAKQDIKDLSFKYQNELNDKKKKSKEEQDKKYQEYKEKLDNLDKKYRQQNDEEVKPAK